MSLQEKEKILAQVEDTGKGQLLSQLQVPRSTYGGLNNGKESWGGPPRIPGFPGIASALKKWRES